MTGKWRDGGEAVVGEETCEGGDGVGCGEEACDVDLGTDEVADLAARVEEGRDH